MSKYWLFYDAFPFQLQSTFSVLIAIGFEDFSIFLFVTFIVHIQELPHI
ncbi:hypothetical protein I600_1390 [Maribacter dokdonensis DSW-8]|nr:hypothetical protein I600_1390 [Maribacter dokdonensis DSW-8]